MVPISILIWVTPEEKILGKSFLKKFLTTCVSLNLKFRVTKQNFLAVLYKKTNCKKPAIDTP